MCNTCLRGPESSLSTFESCLIGLRCWTLRSGMWSNLMVWRSNYVVSCEYKSSFVDVCNRPWWQKCCMCGLTSGDLPWTYFYLVALFPRFTGITFDTFVALKMITYKNLPNRHQHDSNIKQDNSSLHLHARKPRMSRGPRWAGVWTLHRKKGQVNDSWDLFLKSHNIQRKKRIFTRSELPSIPAAPCISEEKQVQCLYFIEDLKDYRSWQKKTKPKSELTLGPVGPRGPCGPLTPMAPCSKKWDWFHGLLSSYRLLFLSPHLFVASLVKLYSLLAQIFPFHPEVHLVLVVPVQKHQSGVFYCYI